MGITTILFALIVLSIVGMILGLIKKNRTIKVISTVAFILLILFYVFIFFVLIPAM